MTTAKNTSTPTGGWYFGWKREAEQAVAEGRINPTCFFVVSVLQNYADYGDGSGARPGLELLMDRTGLSRATVTGALKSGQEAGLIEQVRRGSGGNGVGRASLYRFITDALNGSGTGAGDSYGEPTGTERGMSPRRLPETEPETGPETDPWARPLPRIPSTPHPPSTTTLPNLPRYNMEEVLRDPDVQIALERGDTTEEELEGLLWQYPQLHPREFLPGTDDDYH